MYERRIQLPSRPGPSGAIAHRMILAVIPALVMAGLAAGRALASPAPASAPAAPTGTPVCGAIAVPVTWTAAGSPYTLCAGGVTVGAGVTLTVQPGVTVAGAQFAQLTVRGALRAVGTPGAPITFTGAVTEPGTWYGIAVEGLADGQASVTLDYAIVEYGGAGLGQNLNLVRAQADVRHTAIQFSGKDGLVAGPGSRLISQRIRLLNNGVGTQGLPLALNNTETGDTAFDGIEISGNGLNAIGLYSGEINGDQTWEALGVPYRAVGQKSVTAGATLRIEPGVELQFAPFASLYVHGALEALGLPGRPITFTGVTTAPGSWFGIQVLGDLDREASAHLDYATLEYGGGLFANLYVFRSRAVVDHSDIRHSAGDGLRFNYQSGGSVTASRITDNAGYGLNLDSTSDAVVAANNWWGAASGPLTDDGCNPGGAGQRIGAGVIFRPFLTSAGAAPQPLAPAEAAIMTLTPREWYAPADGQARIRFTASLRDGNGAPLAGRAVLFQWDRGLLIAGSATDLNGNVSGFIVSDTPGDAVIRVGPVPGQCQHARGARTTVTFTPEPPTGGPVFGESAPYVNDNLTIDPLPIARGVPTRLSITATNPTSAPLVIDGAFGYAPLGIGVVFDPIGEVTGTLIPPGGSAAIGLTWLPLISGEYCIEFRYAFRPAAAGRAPTAAAATGTTNANLAVLPGPLKPPPTLTHIQQAKIAFNAYGSMTFVLGAIAEPAAIPFMLAADQYAGNVTDSAFDTANQAGCMLQGGGNCRGWQGATTQYPFSFIGDLMGDPPSQDYRAFAILDTLTFTPAVAAAGMPAARATAINAMTEAQLSTTTRLVAAVVSFDRYAGAVQADDLEWAALQTAAYLHWLGEAAVWLNRTADRIDALITQLNSEGVTNLRLQPAMFAAYQQRLQAQGFTARERAAARATGLTDEAIELMRLSRIDLDPQAAGGSAFAAWRGVAAAYRALAGSLQAIPAFGQGIGSAAPLSRAGAAVTDTRLVRIYGASVPFKLGNPLTRTATISLTARRLDVPLDWLVMLSPLTATLAPGETMTGMVSIVPGTAWLQGTAPRVAIEGYIDGGLLGGIAIDVVAPMRRPFIGRAAIYLPLASRAP